MAACELPDWLGMGDRVADVPGEALVCWWSTDPCTEGAVASGADSI